MNSFWTERKKEENWRVSEDYLTPLKRTETLERASSYSSSARNVPETAQKRIVAFCKQFRHLLSIINRFSRRLAYSRKCYEWNEPAYCNEFLKFFKTGNWEEKNYSCVSEKKKLESLIIFRIRRRIVLLKLENTINERSC